MDYLTPPEAGDDSSLPWLDFFGSVCHNSTACPNEMVKRKDKKTGRNQKRSPPNPGESQMLSRPGFAMVVLTGLLFMASATANAQRPDESRRFRDQNFRDQADLVVEAIRVDRDDIRVRVSNHGDARSRSSRLAVIVVTREGRRTLFAEIESLRPGQDDNIRIRTNFRPDIRGTEIIAIADFFNDVRERNERNNNLTRFVD